ncbi:rod shape-determining protein MreC [Patulibacter sp.]|uniref:rod shape-determining protein MreC n=1 Tax=Patulibacter sp. TaxID=1912859 RepID=UPI002722A6FC|nr:rod shape-determining protein MreC [Patulibacter sp.]MDO9408431.1 rod shape-determining protein MreC [Patulibacter sp.]
MIDPAARRRRRLILAALVVVSLVLITAGFGASGGSSGGPVGALGEGASKIAKPVRDLVRWFGDTADAKGDVEDLRKEAARLRAENGDLKARESRIPQIRRLLEFDQDAALRISSMDPVTASVVGQSPTAWASTIRIDKGTSDGIEVDQPVVGPQGAGAGLVGFVTTARASSSVVTMLPTPGQSIGAKLDGRGTVLTVQGAGAGTSTDLELQYAPSSVSIRRGALVVTSGTNVDPNAPESKAPAGIPIGRITSVSKAGEDGQVGHLRPLVDLKALEVVQVLTKRVDGNRAAPRLPRTTTTTTQTTPAQPGTATPSTGTGGR